MVLLARLNLLCEIRGAAVNHTFQYNNVRGPIEEPYTMHVSILKVLLALNLIKVYWCATQMNDNLQLVFQKAF